MSTVRRPPSVRRPNSSSSASALADGVLDQALHGARAHERVEALFGQVLAQVSVKVTSTFLSASCCFQLQQELVHHTQDDLLRRAA
jgi:hypothetical protein